ncbi:hypothetical protein VXQ05_00760 [Acinetobacter towneri]
MDNREHEIIGSIYDAAVDVNLWPQVIEKLFIIQTVKPPFLLP